MSLEVTSSSYSARPMPNRVKMNSASELDPGEFEYRSSGFNSCVVFKNVAAFDVENNGS